MSEYTEALLNNYREAAKEYAEAKANAERQEHLRKACIATCMKLFADSHKSAAAQEREALASESYADEIERGYQATLRLEMARARLKYWEMSIDLWRTEQANERVERKAYAA